MDVLINNKLDMKLTKNFMKFHSKTSVWYYRGTEKKLQRHSKLGLGLIKLKRTYPLGCLAKSPNLNFKTRVILNHDSTNYYTNFMAQHLFNSVKQDTTELKQAEIKENKYEGRT
jgi:bacillopeptidase F (M6 metalloprotease family)